ncbi:wax ester/triacylglycerol synthase family O-acyltransferase [Amycolatopsis pithecellobii]|uniref:Diacylglycerol O-acyltransferase n=1 Tax=Amycolatopsis pithecellobii TaxID=664692 RepID=A0A6N7Z3H6_9PSEU|nr:wax ester/triacylglycerol synthase family O-acyltransferase [Amycolatopsis pithecellobii]MTD54604.1 wax ester/triacylglycerol synthase family O-acyltransferase [Amycolatopsis pithecellobii]
MERLSPLDAAFLEIEDEDPAAALAIGSIAVVRGPVPAHDELVAAFTALLPLVPRWRQKVRHVPFDLGPPVWVDATTFDPARHFHRLALPAPGDEDALCDLIALIMSERLDRSRPLWECWVVEGLEGGRWAIVSKVHHCMTDGVSGNRLHDVFFREHETAPPPGEPEPEPSAAQLLMRSLRGLVTGPLSELGLMAGGLLAPRKLARRAAEAVRGLGALAPALIPVTPSSLSGPIGRQRRYELAHVSLPEIVAIAKTFGVTVNDVVLAAMSGAFREVLLTRGEKPAPDTLRALVPVSVRAGAGATTMDNQISLMLPLLPVDLADPMRRLVAVHERVAELKGRKEAQAGLAVTTSAQHGPFAPIAWAVRAGAKLPQRSIVTVATNVPGPRHRLAVLSREIEELYPYVPIALRLRTGVAVLSYGERMSFGVTADLDSAPQAHLLADTIERDIAWLAEQVRLQAVKRNSVPSAVPDS